MPKAKLETLIRDYNFYPRTEVSSTHVSQMILAIQAGDTLPPIQADKKTKRIIDGFHRYEAYQRLRWEDAPVDWINCKDDQHFYALAVEANASHGRPFSPFDRAKIRTRAEELGFTIDRVSQILRMPIESLAVQKEAKFGKDSKGNPVPLKRTIMWKAGQTLTARQIKTNEKLGGMNAAYYANQLSELLEADLINWGEDGLISALSRLYEHLQHHSASLKKAA